MKYWGGDDGLIGTSSAIITKRPYSTLKTDILGANHDTLRSSTLILKAVDNFLSNN